MSAALFIHSNGLDLPVAKSPTGQDVVPLKPVSDLYGLSWSSQRQKVLTSARFEKMLGVCLAEVPTAHGTRVQVCVKPERISLYLFALNLNRMRAAGNNAGAERLIERLTLMADVLHANFMAGIAIDKAMAQPGTLGTP